MAGRSAKASENTPQSPESKASESPKTDALQAHQQYEGIAKALAVSSDNRLNSLANSVVESRKPSVEKFVDFLEMAETGDLDLHLIGAELQRRQERKVEQPKTFDFRSEGFGIDLESTVDAVSMLTGFSAAKAIAGV